MGSYALSTTATTYSNTPVTVGNGDNPNIITGSKGTQLGGLKNISGSTNSGNKSVKVGDGSSYNVLDGGAIQAAMDLGSQSIGQIAQLTKDVLAAQASGAVSALNFADKQATTAQAVAEKNVNSSPDTVKYIIYAVVGLGLAYLMKGKF